MYMRGLAVGLALAVVASSAPAQAGGFFSKLFGRAAARGTGAAVAGATTPSGSATAANKDADVKPQKVYDANTLTVDQLAACLQSSSELDRDRQALTTQRSAYETQKSDLQYEKAKLAAEQAKLDKKKTKPLVAAYNTKVDAFNKLVAQTETSRVAFNASVDDIDARSTTHNTRCAKSYYKDDLAAAKAKTGITVADGTLQLGSAR